MKPLFKLLIASVAAQMLMAQPVFAHERDLGQHRGWDRSHRDDYYGYYYRRPYYRNYPNIVYVPTRAYYYAPPQVVYYPQPIYQTPVNSFTWFIR